MDGETDVCHKHAFMKSSFKVRGNAVCHVLKEKLSIPPDDSDIEQMTGIHKNTYKTH